MFDRRAISFDDFVVEVEFETVVCILVSRGVVPFKVDRLLCLVRHSAHLYDEEIVYVERECFILWFEHRYSGLEVVGFVRVVESRYWFQLDARLELGGDGCRCSASDVGERDGSVVFVQLLPAGYELGSHRSHVRVVFLVGDQCCDQGNEEGAESPPCLPVCCFPCQPLVGERGCAEER